MNVLIFLFEYRAARIFFAAESSKFAAKEMRSEKTEVSVVCVDGDGNEGFPGKEIRPTDGGGGSGHFGLIKEAEKKDELRLEDTSSSIGN